MFFVKEYCLLIIVLLTHIIYIKFIIRLKSLDVSKNIRSLVFYITSHTLIFYFADFKVSNFIFNYFCSKKFLFNNNLNIYFNNDFFILVIFFIHFYFVLKIIKNISIKLTRLSIFISILIFISIVTSSNEYKFFLVPFAIFFLVIIDLLFNSFEAPLNYDNDLINEKKQNIFELIILGVTTIFIFKFFNFDISDVKSLSGYHRLSIFILVILTVFPFVYYYLCYFLNIFNIKIIVNNFIFTDITKSKEKIYFLIGLLLIQLCYYYYINYDFDND
jgi:hypothetical protein